MISLTTPADQGSLSELVAWAELNLAQRLCSPAQPDGKLAAAIDPRNSVDDMVDLLMGPSQPYCATQRHTQLFNTSEGEADDGEAVERAQRELEDAMEATCCRQMLHEATPQVPPACHHPRPHSGTIAMMS